MSTLSIKPESTNFNTAFFYSFLLHAVVVGLLFISVDFKKPQPIPAPRIIEAIAIDPKILEPEKPKPKIKPPVDIKPKEDLKKAQAEKQRQAEALRLKKEKARLAAEKKRKAEEMARIKAEQAAIEQQKELEAAKAKKQQARELAILNAQYQQTIRQKVSRNWNKPVSIQSDYACEVSVRQIPGGEVIEVQVKACVGDEAFRRSVENAVYKASPLPYNGFEQVFDRNIIFTFASPES